MAVQLAALVTRAPDQSLQLLETGRLVVGIHATQDFSLECITVPALTHKLGERSRTALASDDFASGEELRIGCMLREKCSQASPGIREQRLIDECDRGRSALDVEEQTAACEVDHACDGAMYRGPQQTGAY